MNPNLHDLQPYPFEKLRDLLHGVTPAAMPPVRLSIGEPQHATPAFIRAALVEHLDGLAIYPTTAGMDRLREAIAEWCVRRYGLARLDPGAEVLPVNGSREALFAFGQCVTAGGPGALVACPNPFYQIYEGAALLAGARPVFLDQTPANGFGLDLDALSADVWQRVQLFYVCSPGNPTGRVLTLPEWQALFELSDRYGVVIASDECYSEIYFDEDRPPLGGLEAAHRLGRSDFRRLVVFSSLSKRSNVPGLRSGFVAGDAAILREFLRYRTYHGCAMSPAVQHASLAAWRDEAHVRENRALYRRKFDALVPMLQPVMGVTRPDAGFYLWARVPAPWGDADDRFSRDLLAATNVAVLPGRYLGRNAHGTNPGDGYVRMALVASVDDCIDAARRIVTFAQSEHSRYADTRA
ncbi:MAG: succinyldiaminopimelate transaminase [Acidobacteria bacterium]|nr:succinyldiaminopimelate transaminase [Acidobacteriota bacterium]